MLQVLTFFIIALCVVFEQREGERERIILFLLISFFFKLYTYFLIFFLFISESNEMGVVHIEGFLISKYVSIGFARRGVCSSVYVNVDVLGIILPGQTLNMKWAFCTGISSSHSLYNKLHLFRNSIKYSIFYTIASR